MSTPPKPPQKMRLKEVPEYIDRRCGRTVTYMTVCNWVNKGVRGEKLKVLLVRQHPSMLYANMRITTTAWVDEFLSHLGV